MDIKFNCPGCSQKLSVDETAAGTEVQCPNCSQPMAVPYASAAPRPAPPPAPATPPYHPLPAFAPPTVPPGRGKALAIWALVLGIIGIIPIVGLATGLIGLALGITALVRKSTGKGLAIAGTILGALAALMIPLHLVMLSSMIKSSRFVSGSMVCVSNMSTISKAIGEYRQKHNGADPAGLEVLVKEGLLPAKALHCPLHENKGGRPSYDYTRSSTPRGSELMVWDSAPHRVVGENAGRTVINADLKVRFLPEDHFRAAPKAKGPDTRAASRTNKPVTPRTGGQAPRQATPQQRAKPETIKEVMTITRALENLKSSQPREMGLLLKFLQDAPVEEEHRAAVIAVVKPLLDDVDAGPLAFEVFARWADKEQVPELIEMLRIAPTSQRGNKCMNLLSRMGDARAAEPLAECLTQFHILRHAQTALAALGDIAKPAVLPYYHHEDGNARKAARELLRGYKATDEEMFAETIKTLKSGSMGARHSALYDLPKARLTPEQQVAAARAIRPLVTDADDQLRKAAHLAMKTLATSADAEFLLDKMGSTDDATRQFATDLLVRMKDARVAKPLAALLGDSKRTYAAGRSLVSLGSAAEPAVIPYLRSDDPPTRKRAAEILADIGTSASLPALQALEKDKDFFIKSSAARAVSAIKSRSAGPNRKR